MTPAAGERSTRLWLVTGDQDSGKSTKMGELVLLWLLEDDSRRAIIADVQREWPYGPLRGRCRPALARTAKGAAELIRTHRVVVVRWDEDLKSDRPTAAMVNELAQVAVDTPCEVALVIPEAQLAFPPHHTVMPPHVEYVLRRSRKARVVVFADAQHPVELHPKLRREARWYVLATRDTDDVDKVLERVKKTVSRDRATLERVHRALGAVDGAPRGTHILIDGARSELEPRR